MTGQLTLPELFPGSFWVITQGHGIIPDGRRFLVMAPWYYDNRWWLAWADGIKPRCGGTLLREKHFRRGIDDDAD